MESLLRIFLVFLKIGAFSFGGGYAMVLIIQREVVERYKWIPLTEFLSLLAIAQSAPGPMVVNTAIMIGYHLRKSRGAAIAALASILPSFVVMLTIALVFSQFADNEYVERFFLGVRPAVVALILASAIIFARRLNKWSYITVIASAAAIYIGISPMILIALGIAGGIYITYRKILKIRKSRNRCKA